MRGFGQAEVMRDRGKKIEARGERGEVEGRVERGGGNESAC